MPARKPTSRTTAKKKTPARKTTTKTTAARKTTAKKRVAAPKRAVLTPMTTTAQVGRTIQKRMARSAAEELGSHLLGRKKPRADRRDFQMRDFLASAKTLTRSFSPSTTLQQLADNAEFDFWSVFPEWNYIKSLRAVAPPPTPGVTKNEWELLIQLDQGQTPHCVGFGSAAWGNSAPIEDSFHNADGHKIYYMAKVIDGEPGKEDGSSVHSGVKAMKQLGRVQSYYFGSTVDVLKQWILEQNPVICGTDWFNDMFNPDANGVVVPTGGVAGGHCYLMLGYDESTDLFEFDNSWGPSWGKKGRFFMHASDVQTLMDRSGAEYCGAVELPIPAAVRRRR
jgi:hypothetical protein